MITATLKHTYINSGNPVYVQGTSISQSVSKTNSNQSNGNYSEDTPVVRVQNTGLSNPLYTISKVALYPTGSTIGGVTALTYELLLDFLVIANDDSDPIILNYTDNSSTSFKTLHKYTGSRTTDIPVTFNGTVSITSSFSATKAKLFEVGSIVLMETKKV